MATFDLSLRFGSALRRQKSTIDAGKGDELKEKASSRRLLLVLDAFVLLSRDFQVGIERVIGIPRPFWLAGSLRESSNTYELGWQISLHVS